MIIKSAAGRAFAAVCLTAIATFSCAHAQMGPAPGSYWAPPGAPYGYAPGPYGPPPGAYGPYGPHREPMSHGASMSRHRLEPA